MNDDRERQVVSYHERTKHDFQRYAASLGYLDWASQPDPFRRFEGAPLVQLPLPSAGDPTPFWKLFVQDAVEPGAASLETISRLLRYSLSITAWKAIPGNRWALRANPSSGNLHPTEGYLLLPALGGLGDQPALYHYAPREHGLERRASFGDDTWQALTRALPAGAFLAGLSSVLWREAWKYGERAWRYCQHDVGHALAALRLAAAAQGWRLALLDGMSSDQVARLLGLDRSEDFAEAEIEEPDLVVAVWPSADSLTLEALAGPGDDALDALACADWQGQANRLSEKHAADWPVIDKVAAAARRDRSQAAAAGFEDFNRLPLEQALFDPLPRAGEPAAESLILGRRSAVRMDGQTSLSAEAFWQILSRLMPWQDNRAVPWDSLPWRPRIHMALFVHRVDGVAPGLYALARDPARLDFLRASIKSEAAGASFAWERPSGCPEALPFFLLAESDVRQLAARLSCNQDIAADGVFAAALLAEFTPSLETHGASFYPRLFWEAGMLGQLLYLEAERVGIRATGIGCYFDDPTHRLLGLDGRGLASFYHFTLGGPLEDERLTTLAAYAPESPSV